MNIKIPPEIEYVISKLQASGHRAYLVGGSIRDFLMGNIPNDYDVASLARPEEVMKIFGKSGGNNKSDSAKVIDTGSKHGTVTVIYGGVHVEVTTFRKESIYSDGRHPDKVIFSDDIKDDLARRDFTVNAMAYNENDGLIDPFGGEADIKRRVIRTVGSPMERFQEDSLRMLRALRFASTYGFKIDEETKDVIFSKKEDIDLRVSKERIQKELEGLLIGDHVEDVLREYAEVIGVVIPEILPMIGFDQHTPYHIYDVWEHSIRVASGMPRDAVSRFAGLFHDIGKPDSFLMGEDGVGHFFGHSEVSYEMTDKIMRRLKFDNATRNDVGILVRWHDLRPASTEKSVRKALIKVTPRLFDKWIALKRADNSAHAPHLIERIKSTDEIDVIGHRLIDAEGALSLKTLDITGRDIMSLGIDQGPKIGEIMRSLLNEVLEERIENKKEDLITKAKELKDVL